jgi:hypothetical protein
MKNKGGGEACFRRLLVLDRDDRCLFLKILSFFSSFL